MTDPHNNFLVDAVPLLVYALLDLKELGEHNIEM